MAWDFDGGWLAAGASVTWAYWWGDSPHEYRGIQVVQARPERRGSVIVVDGSPRLTVRNPALQLESYDSDYTYFVTVSNDSTSEWYHYTVIGQRVD